MSFNTRRPGPFFGPLRGNSSVFIVDSRETNLALARALIAGTETTCVVLDIDALYSSEADFIMGNLSESQLRSVQIRIPEPGSDLEPHISSLFASNSRLLIIDSMNSLNHLLSSENRNSGSRKLSFTVAGLSYLARTSGRAVVLTMYQRELTRTGGGMPMSNLSDITVAVERRGSELGMRCTRGQAWPAWREFSFPIT